LNNGRILKSSEQWISKVTLGISPFKMTVKMPNQLPDAKQITLSIGMAIGVALAFALSRKRCKKMLPSQSLEPTPVGCCNSAFRG
jgi:hypothetical protein